MTSPVAPQKRSVPRRRRVAAGAGLLALALGSTAAVAGMTSAADSTASCAAPAKVNVAVAPELYGTVAAQAQELAKNPAVCAQYVVTRASGESTNKAVKAGGTGIPDVWIPDSSVWVDDATATLGAGWVSSSGSIASSPIVIGVPDAQKALPGLDKAATWGEVMAAGQLPVSLQNTGASASALETLAMANRTATNREDRTNLLRAVIRLSRSTLSPEGLAQRAAAGPDQARAYPLSEQQLMAFDKANPGKPMRALVPDEGAPSLDYPFVRPIKGSGAPTTATDALLAALRSPAAKTSLESAGLRVPGGQAPAGSPLPTDLRAARTPSATENVSSVKSWGDLAKDARMLVLVDVSGSMNIEVSPGQTRADLLGNTAKLALNALPGTTQIGAWAFSTNLDGRGKDYLAMVPNVAEIGNTPAGIKHKNELITKLGLLPGLVARNGDTGLYDSIWAAYQSATKTYRDGYVNSIVVLTDGKNDDPGGGLSLQQLLGNLRKAYNADKPIKIVAISMGDETDPEALKQVAKSTDGLSYVTKNPAEISTVFVDAFLHRS
ncbi:VWA domain-containing protein [Yimella sp. cx-573]|nr:VWA domain-containing protein [Yimella sp. cx-573]